mmetsp:Transcript_21890/g.33984  ORF Transcript_21890/g.33984 Transcript_21890/m.33984 type:complete len:200 (-) Transcript_21890:246-845(-)
MGQDVTHLVGALLVAVADVAEEFEDLDLEEGIFNASDLTVRLAVAHEEVLEDADQVGHILLELFGILLVVPTDLNHEGHRGHQHRLRLLVDQVVQGVQEVVDGIWHLLDDAESSQASLGLHQVRLGLHLLLHVHVHGLAHVRSGDLGDGSQGQGGHVVVVLRVVQILLDALGHHHQDLGGLVHQLGKPQVSDTLLGEVV